MVRGSNAPSPQVLCALILADNAGITVKLLLLFLSHSLNLLTIFLALRHLLSLSFRLLVKDASINLLYSSVYKFFASFYFYFSCSAIRFVPISHNGHVLTIN